MPVSLIFLPRHVAALLVNIQALNRVMLVINLVQNVQVPQRKIVLLANGLYPSSLILAVVLQILS